MSSEKYEAGMKVRRRVLGDEYVDAALARATDFTRPLQDLVTANCWGEVWAQGIVPDRTRSLVTLAVLVALRASAEIKTHTLGALRNGCSVDEIRDVLLHATVYCGVPAGVEAFRAAGEVVETWQAAAGGRPHAMSVGALDHVVLTVRDIEATCAFYSRALGMRVVRFGEGRTALAFGRQKINLHQHGRELEPKAQAPTPGSGDLCFVTAVPIADVLAHLDSLGIDVLEGPVRRTGALGPITSVYFRDPDGNLVEVSNYESA